MNKMVLRMLLPVMVMLMILPMTGCNRAESEMDAQSMLEALLNNVRYDSELQQVGSNAELYFLDLPQNTTIQLYTGSGYFADEVALLTLPSKDDSSEAMKAVRDHIRELRDQFTFYVPEELDKIDHAVTYQNGRYIFLCITNDYTNAERILNHNGHSVDVVPASPEQKEQELPEAAQETEDTGNTSPDKEAEISVVTEPQVEYPVLKSESGTYHDYGTYAIRVDNSAFELYNYSDSRASDYAALVNKTAEKLAGKVTVYDIAIPTAVGIVLPDDIAAILPGYTDQGEAIKRIFSKMSDQVITVDCFNNLMRHRDEYLYFNTDYHWNGRGAYYAYESFCNTKGIDAIPLDERTEKQFGGFLGALYWNNCGKDPMLENNPDTVFAYCHKSESASMTFTDKNGDSYNWKIIMDVSGWKASAKYSTFAGADNPFAVFTNPDVTDGSVCVIVKESYGNALLPYLVDHYSTIYEIDYRYWNGDLIGFALEKEADDLIFANNLSMISSNLLIGKLAGIIG